MNAYPMNRIRIKTGLLLICIHVMVYTAAAQQITIAHLILLTMNEAAQGYPTLMKDTVADAVFAFKLTPQAIQPYANVKDVKIDFKRNYKSLLLNDSLFTLCQLRIRSESILIPANKSWKDFKDTLTAYYNLQVDFFKKAFGSQLNYSSIIPLENEEDADFKPRYLIYFYSKALQLPDSLTNKYEIEKQLDVTSWFTIELQEQPLLHHYNMVYRVSGGKRQ